jgi:hypothetical protein
LARDNLVPQAGGHPYWSPKGDELILNVNPVRSVSVAVTTTPTVGFGRPADFSRTGRIEPNPAINRRGADAMPDGQHVIGVMSAGVSDAGSAPVSHIIVVLNWFEELKARVPTK